jgi:hypothetical protein
MTKVQNPDIRICAAEQLIYPSMILIAGIGGEANSTGKMGHRAKILRQPLTSPIQTLPLPHDPYKVWHMAKSPIVPP